MKLIQLFPCHGNLTARKCVWNKPGRANNDPTKLKAHRPPAHGQAHVSSPPKPFTACITCELGIYSHFTPSLQHHNVAGKPHWRGFSTHGGGNYISCMKPASAPPLTAALLRPAPANQGKTPKGDQLSSANRLLRVLPETSLSSIAPTGTQQEGLPSSSPGETHPTERSGRQRDTINLYGGKWSFEREGREAAEGNREKSRQKTEGRLSDLG